LYRFWRRAWGAARLGETPPASHGNGEVSVDETLGPRKDRDVLPHSFRGPSRQAAAEVLLPGTGFPQGPPPVGGV